MIAKAIIVWDFSIIDIIKKEFSLLISHLNYYCLLNLVKLTFT